MKKLTTTLCVVFFAVGIAYSQRTVTGTITDEGNEPLIGTSVVVKGGTVGTVTDLDGTFSLQVPDGATELVISYTGFESQTINIENQSILTLVLQEGLVIDEVVVIGYSSRKRSELVGSSVQVNSDELEQIPVASVDQILMGKVAGLSISGTSGTPGSKQNIRIRGVSSVTAGNEPLYVIDGVPMSNPDLAYGTAGSTFSSLAALNPNDIASVTVLKDASATAVYGARGSNGVIVITTKRGKSGKTTFNLNTSYGISNDATEGPVMLTASEREELFYEAIYNTYGESEGFNRDGAKAYYEANPNAFGTKYVDWNAAGRPSTVWADIITNDDAPIREVNFSASGGDELQNFYASFGYYDAEATVIGSDYRRFTGSLKYSRSLTNKIRFDTRNTVSNIRQDGLLEQSAYFSSPRAAKYFMTPLATPYNDDGTLNLNNLGTNVRNPLWIAANDIRLNKLTRLISNNSVSWETPIPNLNFTTRMNIDYSVNNYKGHQNRVHGDGADVGGSATGSNRNITNFVFQNSLDYSLYINNNHHFDIKVLQEYQENERYELEAYGEGFAANGLSNLNSVGSPLDVGSSFVDWKVASYTGMVNYDYANKYILSATYRREGNSRFHPDNRWGNFWSVGAAWNLDRETFLSDLAMVDNLKLRVSYGRTGNDNIGLNKYQALFSFDADYGGSAAVYPSTVGNVLLSWETADNFETGIDFGLFQSRVNGTLTYFRRETKENLFDVPLSLTTGFASQTRNIGRMENKGIELELGVDIIRSKDLNLTIGGNLATVNNEVLELPVDGNGDEIPVTTGTRSVETGHKVYEWYMRKFAGVDPQTGENLYYLNGEGSETTTDYNAAERVFHGASALPTLTAGINIHFDFKGFFVDAYGYYAGGHMVYEDWTRYTNGTDLLAVDLFNGINSLLDRWQQPGDVTRISKMTATYEPWRTHSKYLSEGDYFRLRNITFGYTLPSSVTQNVGIENAKVFVRGINTYTWVKDDNMQYDPEVEADGFAVLTTPPVKTLMFGLNLKF